MIEFRWARGHIEVFEDGEFLFSADTRREAEEELEHDDARKAG